MKKTTSIILAFLLIFFPVTPSFNSLFAETSPAASPLLEEPTAEISAAPATSDIQPFLEEAAGALETTDFLSEGPLSRYEGEEEEVLLESNDPFYGTSGSWGQSYDDLWWLKRVNADDAWAYSRGTNVPVAVIDTGLDYNHPDIASNLWTNQVEASGLAGVDDDGNGFIDDLHGWDYYNWDNNPFDDHGHGTHVAGIIGAVADNALGIAGIAPESKIIPIKVLNSAGSGYVTDVINAIRYAANLGAKVINLSLGVFKNYLSKSLQNAFKSAVSFAKSMGAVVVAAAGNEGSKVENSYPAGISDVIAVGATNSNDIRASWSNFGKLLDLVAPGVDILSTVPVGSTIGSSSGTPNYRRLSGTSMASPVVAGVVALIRAYNPSLTYDQIVSRLRSTATDLGAAGFDQYYGYGLVNALAAVTGSAAAFSSSLASTESIGQEDGSNDRRSARSRSFVPSIDISPISPLPVLRPFTHYRRVSNRTFRISNKRS